MRVFNRSYATISLRNLYFNIIMVNSPFPLKNISDRVGILTKIFSEDYYRIKSIFLKRQGLRLRHIQTLPGCCAARSDASDGIGKVCSFGI